MEIKYRDAEWSYSIENKFDLKVSTSNTDYDVENAKLRIKLLLTIQNVFYYDGSVT